MDRLLQMLPIDWFIVSVGERVTPVRIVGDGHYTVGWKCSIQYRHGGGRLIEAEGDTPMEALKMAIIRATVRHPAFVMFRKPDQEPQLAGSVRYRGRSWDDGVSEIGGAGKRVVVQ